jgi:hypothetical protein
MSEPTKQDKLPEAAASVTYTITSPAGFNALFTIREINGIALLDLMETIEKTLKDKKYIPQIKTFGGGFKKPVEYVEGKICPLCKGRIIKDITKAGKEYHKCENGKYNFQTKQTEGCKYVDWLNPAPTTTPMDAEQWGA